MQETMHAVSSNYGILKFKLVLHWTEHRFYIVYFSGETLCVIGNSQDGHIMENMERLSNCTNIWST